MKTVITLSHTEISTALMEYVQRKTPLMAVRAVVTQCENTFEAQVVMQDKDVTSDEVVNYVGG